MDRPVLGLFELERMEMQIDRKGRVSFGDASLHVWEEPGRRVDCEWERNFKRDVFSRMVQQLNRMGFSLRPCTHIFTGNNARYGEKNGLRLDLRLGGRHIELNFFQNVNAPERPDSGGRYQNNKENHMPYLMRIRMERTRRRLTTYLCNVFKDYAFNREPKPKTATARIALRYEKCCHIKGDPVSYYDKNGPLTSADGGTIHPLDRVWFFDRKGRIQTGIAYPYTNQQFMVATGKYDLQFALYHRSLYLAIPADFRTKRNEDLRRKRLESELRQAVKAMNFVRAETIKHLLWPEPEELYLVWHKGHSAYHRTGWCGYTEDTTEAGKFTKAELARMNKNTDKAIRLPVEAA